MKSNWKSFAALLFAAGTLLSCSKEDEDDSTSTPSAEPTTLDCDYFKQDRILTNNPDAPIDYIITCQAPVDGDLVIQPGVVIAFQTDAGLEVFENGSISAIGTQEEPIVMTGVDKAAGSWSGIMIYSKDVKNVLNYCTVEFGGGSPFNSNDDRGNIILYADGKLTVEHCAISNSATYGIHANYKSGRFVSIDHNTFSSNKAPIYVRANLVDAIGSDNLFSKNTGNYVEVGCGAVFENENGDKTWNKLEVPYRITTTDFGITDKITVPPNGNLTLAPGIQMEFATSVYIYVEDNASLKAVGTANEPLLFTGIDKAPGAWGGIEFAFTKSTRNEIAHATFEYGADSNIKGSIYMWADPKLNVHDCTFKDLEGCAFVDADICFCNPNLTESNNTFVNADDYCFD